MRLSVLLGAQAGFFILLAIVWEVVSRLELVDPRLLPSFLTVLGVLGDLLTQGEFLVDLGITGLEVGVAFVIAAPLGVSIGFLLGEKLHLGQILSPMFHFMMSVPQSIFLPIFMLVLGIGFLEKVVFGITHAIFVIIVTTTAAVRTVPRDYVTVARTFGATPRQIYLRVYLPAMLPVVMTGLRLGMIFNIIGVLLAEMDASRAGIGRRLFSWGEGFQLDLLLAGILLVSALTIIINEVMRYCEHRAARGHVA